MHPTAPVIAVVSNAVQPKLFDHQMIEELPLERKKGWHDGAVTAVAFSSNGRFLAGGAEDGRISIWEKSRAGIVAETLMLATSSQKRTFAPTMRRTDFRGQLFADHGRCAC
jgi:WD40 repeat protein